MTKQKRWTSIIEACRYKESISVDELIELLHVSPATVRRDLQEMDDLNMISRFHGGARLNGAQFEEPSMIIKTESNSAQKKQIAYTAARMILDNQMIYIDAGSTTFEMLAYIRAKNITVVTPGIPHLSVLGQRGISTIVLGGILRWSTQAITSKQALKQLDELYFDSCFIGTNAIHSQVGFTTSNEMEADTKALAIHHSRNAYILADSSKFNTLALVPFARLDEAIIICDDFKNFDSNIIRYIKTNG